MTYLRSTLICGFVAATLAACSGTGPFVLEPRDSGAELGEAAGDPGSTDAKAPCPQNAVCE